MAYILTRGIHYGSLSDIIVENTQIRRSAFMSEYNIKTGDEEFRTVEQKFIEVLDSMDIKESEVHRKSVMANGLTMKQFIFCELYLRNGGDTRKASKEAGYSNKCKGGDYGTELIKKPVISKYIMEKMQKSLRIKNLSSDDVIERLINVAMFNIKDAVSWDKNSVTYKSSDELPDHVTACIKSVNEIKIAGGHKTVRVEFHDNMKALDTLTKLMGLHQDTVLHKHIQVDKEELDADELEAELKRVGLLGHDSPIIEGVTEEPADQVDIDEE